MIKSLIPFFFQTNISSTFCFVHILTPKQDKLLVKAKKCVFLSYSKLQPGYRCYSPDTHRYFVSVMSHFLKTLLCFLSPTLLILMSYIYPSFIQSRMPHLYLRLLHLNHYRFILVNHVLKPGLQLTHLLWRHSPRCRSCRLPLIFLFPFRKVLVALITPILVIIF